MPQHRLPLLTRYLAKIQGMDDPAACWLWTGARDQDGYGIFWDGTYRANGHGRYVRVTRWTYERFVGPLHGLHVCHSCDNPTCVNPSHLFAGSNAQNMADRESKGRGRRMQGSTHVGSKLTEADVRKIRLDRAAGVSQASLARQHGVSTASISKIVNRLVWTHI